MVENVVGTVRAATGHRVNFVIDGRDVLVPMVIEEPSVVAGASFAARLVRRGWRLPYGDHRAAHDRPDASAWRTNLAQAASNVEAGKARPLDLANSTDPVIVSLHGGARGHRSAHDR